MPDAPTTLVSTPPEAPPAAEAPKPVPPTESTVPPSATQEAPVNIPKKEIPTQEKKNAILELMGKKYLDEHNPTVGMLAMARLAGEGKPTELGKELQNDVLRMLQTDESAPENLKNFSIPEPNEKLISDFLDKNSPALGQQMKTEFELMKRAGSLTVDMIAARAQTYEPLRGAFFKALLAEEQTPPVTATDMIHALHMETNDTENLQKWNETFHPIEPKKKVTMGDVMQKTLSGAFAAFMVMQFCMAVSQESQQSHH